MLTVNVDSFGIVTSILDGQYTLFDCAPVSIHEDIKDAVDFVNTNPGQYTIAIYEKTSGHS